MKFILITSSLIETANEFHVKDFLHLTGNGQVDEASAPAGVRGSNPRSAGNFVVEGK